MLRLLCTNIYLTLALLLINHTAFAQCNINFCSGSPVLTASAPVFNPLNSSININNVTFGNIGCTQGSYTAGLDIYIYQLLPNGSRVENCNVLNPSPSNVLGNVKIGLGQTSICGSSINLGTITIDGSNGFMACDGALYEVELALYITTNTGFLNSNLTVYSQLQSSEYLVNNLGTVEANMTNSFPGSGQPLILSNISEWGTGNSGTLNVACNTDVSLFVQGQSILANCPSLADYNAVIPSQMINAFSYLSGGTTTVVQSAFTGAAGGQTSGPDPNLNGACYSGILTDVAPYVFLASNVANPCNGNSVILTISTTDSFTGQTVSDQITIVYGTVPNCPTNLTYNSNILSGTYAASQSITATNSISSGQNVNFEAGNVICLDNNFEVNQNADFSAIIDPCP